MVCICLTHNESITYIELCAFIAAIQSQGPHMPKRKRPIKDENDCADQPQKKKVKKERPDCNDTKPHQCSHMRSHLVSLVNRKERDRKKKIERHQRRLAAIDKAYDHDLSEWRKLITSQDKKARCKICCNICKTSYCECDKSICKSCSDKFGARCYGQSLPECIWKGCTAMFCDKCCIMDAYCFEHKRGDLICGECVERGLEKENWG